MSIKGIASYHSVKVGDETVEDLLWYYPELIAAAEGIRNRLCFFNEKVDLEVEGEAQDRPRRSGLCSSRVGRFANRPGSHHTCQRSGVSRTAVE